MSPDPDKIMASSFFFFKRKRYSNSAGLSSALGHWPQYSARGGPTRSWFPGGGVTSVSVYIIGTEEEEEEEEGTDRKKVYSAPPVGSPYRQVY